MDKKVWVIQTSTYQILDVIDDNGIPVCDLQAYVRATWGEPHSQFVDKRFDGFSMYGVKNYQAYNHIEVSLWTLTGLTLGQIDALPIRFHALRVLPAPEQKNHIILFSDVSKSPTIWRNGRCFMFHRQSRWWDRLKEVATASSRMVVYPTTRLSTYIQEEPLNEQS